MTIVPRSANPHPPNLYSISVILFRNWQAKSFTLLSDNCFKISMQPRDLRPRKNLAHLHTCDHVFRDVSGVCTKSCNVISVIKRNWSRSLIVRRAPEWMCILILQSVLIWHASPCKVFQSTVFVTRKTRRYSKFQDRKRFQLPMKCKLAR